MQFAVCNKVLQSTGGGAFPQVLGDPENAHLPVGHVFYVVKVLHLASGVTEQVLATGAHVQTVLA